MTLPLIPQLRYRLLGCLRVGYGEKGGRGDWAMSRVVIEEIEAGDSDTFCVFVLNPETGFPA